MHHSCVCASELLDLCMQAKYQEPLPENARVVEVFALIAKYEKGLVSGMPAYSRLSDETGEALRVSSAALVCTCGAQLLHGQGMHLCWLRSLAAFGLSVCAGSACESWRAQAQFAELVTANCMLRSASHQCTAKSSCMTSSSSMHADALQLLTPRLHAGCISLKAAGGSARVRLCADAQGQGRPAALCGQVRSAPHPGDS